MTIIYQGKAYETEAGYLGTLINELGLDRNRILLEYNGEAIAPGAVLTQKLKEGDVLNVFHIVAGG